MLSAISLSLWVLLYFFKLTCRIRIINPEVLDGVKEKDGNYIYATWHENIFSALLLNFNIAHASIISRSRDGDIVSGVAERMGYKLARGSSGKGGAEAVYEMATLLRSGYPGAITVDGPRGPAHKVKRGVFILSQMTKFKIIPLACLPRRYWCFKKSWDKFRLPKPFTTIDIFFADPITVGDDLSSTELEILSEKLKNSLEQGEKQISKILLSN